MFIFYLRVIFRIKVIRPANSIKYLIIVVISNNFYKDSKYKYPGGYSIIIKALPNMYRIPNQSWVFKLFKYNKYTS